MTLATTHKKLQQGQGFASLKLVDEFIVSAALPAIHNDMGKAMEMISPTRRRGALDLGACHGLLMVRARRMGWQFAHGVDVDEPTVGVFRQHVMPKQSRITMEVQRLDVRSPAFASWLSAVCDTGINTILARRILPELFSDTYGKAGLTEPVWRDAGLRFSAAARAAGIEFMVVEGRQHAGRKNLANPLYRVENEVDALGPGWSVKGRLKECIVLEVVR